MKRLTIAAAFCALAMAGTANQAQAADAQKVFNFYCAQCHGTAGKGKGPNVTKDFPVSPRDFTNAAEMDKLSDADMKNVILDGGPAASKSPMMPPWSKTLKGDDVDALVGYLRKFCGCKGKQG